MKRWLPILGTLILAALIGVGWMAWKRKEPTPAVIAETPQPPSFITVIGAVRAPGTKVPWREGMNLFSAINRAGGTSWDSPGNIRIIRGQERITVNVRGAGNNPELLPGDIVELPE